MAKFKCLLSGNIFEFKYEWDIEEMREHPQYEEIEEDGLQTEEKQNSKEKVKKPRKTKEAK